MTVELNDLVVAKICSYLLVPDLKNIRLLNSTWKRGAESGFRHKSRIQLKMSADHYGVAKLYKFLGDTENFGACRNLSIEIQTGVNCDIEPFITLCRQVCTNFLQPSLYSLTLKNKVGFMNQKLSYLTEDILNYFSFTLESLNLDLHFADLNPAMEFRHLDKLTFPNLKILNNSCTEYYLNQSRAELMPFCSMILHADIAPVLESLTLSHPIQFCQRIDNDRNILPNLVTLEIIGDVGEEEVNAITKTSWKLKRLSLTLVSYLDAGNNCLTQLLSKISPSLEHLAVYNVVQMITLPSCPKLKNLSTVFKLTDGEASEYFDHGDLMPCIKFETDKVAQTIDCGYFPVLKVFNVKVFDSYGSLLDFESKPMFFDFIWQLFSAPSFTVFRHLEILRVPEDWENVEEDIRERFPPEVKILFDAD